MLIRKKAPIPEPLPAPSLPFRQRPTLPMGEIDTWCAQHSPWPRLLAACFTAYVGINYWLDSEYTDISAGINLAFHEIGHVVFAPFGQFLGILGGSLFQCMIPLFTLWIFRRQKDWFGMAFALAWLGSNIYGVARYLADAQLMELPLVSPFGSGDSDEITHDWNWILTDLGWLHHTDRLAGTLRLLGALVFLAHMLASGWLIWRMIQLRRHAPPRQL